MTRTEADHYFFSEFNAILQSASSAIVSVDLSGNILRWSIGAERIFGYNEEEALGSNWGRLAPVHCASELKKSLDKVLRGRTVPVMQSQRLRKDGTIIDVEYSIFPVHSHDDGVLIGATTITTDITARKSTEQALYISAGQIQTIVQTVLDGIITIDKVGTIESINPAAENIFQYRAHELIGCNVKVLMPEPYRSEHDGYLQHFADTGEAKVIGIGREVLGQRKDGSVFPMSLAVNQMLSSNSAAYVGVISDITETKEREKQLKEQIDKTQSSNTELEKAIQQLRDTQERLVQSEKMASLGSLVAGLAHEINTPIGVGVTAASYLSSSTSELSKSLAENTLKRSELNQFVISLNDTANLISKNLDRAATLITSFKHVAVDQTNDDDREIDLHDYLQEILTSFQPQLKKHRVTVELSCPVGIVFVTNPGSLYQVLSNLMMNSTLHGYDEGEQGEIFITAKTIDEQIEIIVRDTGKGIPAENLPKLFDPFFTTSRHKGGTGLGLHISFNLVTQSLGGFIHVESQPGEGTQFVITIPLSNNHSAPK
ncbi:PAS domain-containing sensor histidine kinase [Zhongshania arctica]|uniref:histidine kinase n=1 Tax=Zhongshania arctica TaxID=3238302 RepID=A0ABV3TWM4_9GAMM